MRRRHPWLLAVISALLAAQLSAVVERRVEKRFALPEGQPSLKVDAFSGVVRVMSVDGAREIEVAVFQRADVDSEAGMDTALAPLSLSIEEAGPGEVRLTSRYDRSMTWSWKSWPPVVLIYDIKVPLRCDVEVATTDGSISIGKLRGQVVLTNGLGNIFTDEIDGAVRARSGSGEVAITACTGEIYAGTRTGAITVGRAGGRTRLASEGGYIELQRASGPVEVRGNGSHASVGFVAPVLHEADIRISGAELMLILEAGSVCRVDLRSSLFGSVRASGEALPWKVTGGGLGRSRLEASLGEGGPLIRARVRGGDVRVRGVEPLPSVAADLPRWGCFFASHRRGGVLAYRACPMPTSD